MTPINTATHPNIIAFTSPADRPELPPPVSIGLSELSRVLVLVLAVILVLVVLLSIVLVLVIVLVLALAVVVYLEQVLAFCEDSPQQSCLLCLLKKYGR